MPIDPGTTVDDIIRHVVSVATSPRWVRMAGMVEDTEDQRRREIDASNFGVFVLRAVGLSGDEIRALYDKENDAEARQ